MKHYRVFFFDEAGKKWFTDVWSETKPVYPPEARIAAIYEDPFKPSH